jgi:hypothetical protein
MMTRFSLLLLVGVLVALVLTVEAKKGASGVTPLGVSRAMVNFKKAQFVLAGPTTFDIIDVDARTQQMERVKRTAALRQQNKELNRIKIDNRREEKRQSKLMETSDIGMGGKGGIEVKAVTQRVDIVEDAQDAQPAPVVSSSKPRLMSLLKKKRQE